VKRCGPGTVLTDLASKKEGGSIPRVGVCKKKPRKGGEEEGWRV